MKSQDLLLSTSCFNIFFLGFYGYSGKFLFNTTVPAVPLCLHKRTFTRVNNEGHLRETCLHDRPNTRNHSKYEEITEEDNLFWRDEKQERPLKSSKKALLKLSGG